MRRSNTIALALATVLAATALLAGCHHEDPDSPTMLAQVVVIRPQRGEAVRSIALPGDVVGYYQSALYAKVTGYLKNILVDKGDRVKKGQVLADSQATPQGPRRVLADPGVEHFHPVHQGGG